MPVETERTAESKRKQPQMLPSSCIKPCILLFLVYACSSYCSTDSSSVSRSAAGISSFKAVLSPDSGAHDAKTSTDSLLQVDPEKNTSAGPARSPLGAAASIAPQTSQDSLQGAAHDNRALFARLGNYHRAFGAYTLVLGILAIGTGVVFLDKKEVFPFSVSCITLGGITAGIGIWEISMGLSLKRHGSGP
jgi:hypothetical protein